MVIKKEQICCIRIRDSIDRYGHLIRMFIREVNKQMPEGMKFNKETFVVERQKSMVMMGNGETCEGYSYRIIWAYTPKHESIIDKHIIILQQKNTVSFVLECFERACDHKKSEMRFLSLYGKPSNGTDLATRLDCIYDESREFFDEFNILQVVDKMI